VTRGPVRTVFFGSGAFAIPILVALLAAPEIDVVAVVSAPDRPVGRRREPTPTPLAARAALIGLPLLRPSRFRDEAAIAEVAAVHPSLGILADYGRIVPQAVLDVPRHGILNVHPSLLPRHRGATPIPAAILAGDVSTGVTIIRMDAGLDTGPIVASETWPLDGTETAPELETRASVAGAELLVRILPRWLDGSIVPRPQAGEAATVTRPLRREDGRLDPSEPASELARRVRALQPWPGSYVETASGRLTVWRALAVPSEGEDVPGQLVRHGIRPALTTVAGRLLLEEVQPSGGRRMTGDAFLRGRSLDPIVLPDG